MVLHQWVRTFDGRARKAGWLLWPLAYSTPTLGRMEGICIPELCMHGRHACRVDCIWCPGCENLFLVLRRHMADGGR